jgi:sn-1 stearoyl-lipid 9-desaturase
MTKIINVRLIQLINHFLFAIGIAYCFTTGDFSYLILSVIFYYILGILGINIGYHRLLSHRSFITYKPVYYLLTILGTITAMGSSLSWVAVHRQHHRYSDTELDPHSPHILGSIKSWLGFWGNIKIDLRNCNDIRKSSFHRYLHKNYILIQLLYVSILASIDPLLIIFGYAIPCVLVFHSAGAFDVIAHVHGYRSHNTKDQSRNSWIANVITMGEGWHNNHHANPGNYSNKERWWEFDPSGIIIALIKKHDK